MAAMMRKMSISSIFEEEILENCRFWEVQTSGFGLFILFQSSARTRATELNDIVPQNTAYV
jgi:hypothetical protein